MVSFTEMSKTEAEWFPGEMGVGEEFRSEQAELELSSETSQCKCLVVQHPSLEFKDVCAGV